MVTDRKELISRSQDARAVGPHGYEPWPLPSLSGRG